MIITRATVRHTCLAGFPRCMYFMFAVLVAGGERPEGGAGGGGITYLQVSAPFSLCRISRATRVEDFISSVWKLGNYFLSGKYPRIVMHVSVGQQWGKASILQLVAPCSGLPTTFNAVIPPFTVLPSTYRDRSGSVPAGTTPLTLYMREG